MRIGVVSDTHNNLRNVKKIIELFNLSAVDRVLHTGDISQAKTINLFTNLNAPLYGVFGNNDQGELTSLTAAITHHGFHFVQPPLKLHWADRNIIVVHDPLALEDINLAGYDVILHGHTHRQKIDYIGSQLTFNPGECAGIVPGKNAVSVLDLVSLQTEILYF